MSPRVRFPIDNRSPWCKFLCRPSAGRLQSRFTRIPSASERLPMSSPGSVTHWLGLLKAGDHAAAQPLWERYFQHLVSLARSRLWGAPKRMADEEDVALSAFDSFCRGAAEGRFPQLLDRNDLCQLLVLITARKAIHLLQHERRQKRGGGKVQAETELAGTDEEPLLAQLIGQEPTP